MKTANMVPKLVMPAFLLLFLLSGMPAYPLSESCDSPSQQVLTSDGSTITWNSSFCEVSVSDTVQVTLTGAVGDAATVTVSAVAVRTKNKATPSRGRGGGGHRDATISVSGIGTRTVDITLDSATSGWHTVHIVLTLSNGDKLGVNLHSTPCEICP